MTKGNLHNICDADTQKSGSLNSHGGIHPHTANSDPAYHSLGSTQQEAVLTPTLCYNSPLRLVPARNH